MGSITLPDGFELALPDWCTELRPHQVDAIQEAVYLFEDEGCEVVFLDGPTGTGKTIIAEAIRQRMGGDALYVCSSLVLQDQFKKDFDYARVLKGRSNYRTLEGPPEVTAADCTSQGRETCKWCPSKAKCPYQVAKAEAVKSDLMVVNTAYFLTEANMVEDPITVDRNLVIVDEADVLEKELMGFATFEVSGRTLDRLGLKAPIKAARKQTIQTWIEDLAKRLLAEREKMQRKGRQWFTLEDWRWFGLINKTWDAAMSIAPQVMEERWIRDYPRTKQGEMYGFIMRPVVVHEVGWQNLWQHGERFLCMSATLVSPQEMADSLGITDKGVKWGEVIVPMTFPVHNRPLFVTPVADMSKRGLEEEGSLDKALVSMVKIIERYEDDIRVLIHSVSYQLTKDIAAGLRKVFGNRVVHYTNAQERGAAQRKYEQTPGAILVAPSMDRGVDFAGDLCRVQIVAKVPFPSLGDRMVSTRMHLPGGDTWYAVQTVRTLVQMTGRGVRSKRDWCDTWIIDSQFTRNVLKKSRRLLPGWWKEALVTDFRVRDIT